MGFVNLVCHYGAPYRLNIIGQHHRNSGQLIRCIIKSIGNPRDRFSSHHASGSHALKVVFLDSGRGPISDPPADPRFWTRNLLEMMIVFGQANADSDTRFLPITSGTFPITPNSGKLKTHFFAYGARRGCACRNSIRSARHFGCYFGAGKCQCPHFLLVLYGGPRAGPSIFSPQNRRDRRLSAPHHSGTYL